VQIPAQTPVQSECRECCSFCDRVVRPSGCVAAGCRYLYFYDEERSGRRYMGCLNKVFKVEIDFELFQEAQRTRQGYGGVKLSAEPLPVCDVAVERAYQGHGEAFECVNPDFFEVTDPGPDAFRSFDLRDRL
jgi:hypothetical protein